MTTTIRSLVACLYIGAAACQPKDDPPPEECDDTTAGDMTSSTTTSSTTTSSTTTPPNPPPMTTMSSASEGDDSTTFPFPDLGDDSGGTIIECDTFDQDCPAGMKCMPYADHGDFWNLMGCFPIDGNPGQPGDECVVEGSPTSGFDSCELGSMCWDVDTETNMGVCAPLCSGTEANPICEDPDTTCAWIDDALKVCLRKCDPIIQDCLDGQGCYMIGGFGSAEWVCSPDRSGEYGGQGDECFYFGSCDPGLVCVDAGSVPDCDDSHCCTEICELTDPLADVLCDGLVGHQDCEPLYGPGAAPPGQEDVGVCIIPS